MPERPTLSIVVPAFNEAQTLPDLYERTRAALDSSQHSWELVLVDDGSADDTWRVISDLARRDSRVRGIRLSRNFGQQAAIAAGLDHAAGQTIIVMDADLQNPPELIPQMLELIAQGFEVVHAAKIAAADSPIRRALTRLFYWLQAILVEEPMAIGSGTFCAMSRRVVHHIRAMPQRARYLTGLRSYVGFKQTTLTFRAPRRAHGRPRQSLTKLLAAAGDAIFPWGGRAARAGIVLGAIGLILTFALLIDAWLSGWGAAAQKALIALLALFAASLCWLGVLGEYIWRIYREVLGRPTYIVAEQTAAEGAEPAESSQQNPAKES